MLNHRSTEMFGTCDIRSRDVWRTFNMQPTASRADGGAKTFLRALVYVPLGLSLDTMLKVSWIC